MAEPTRFPLAWPGGRPRTKYPKNGHFSTKSPHAQHGYMVTREITVAQAMDRLEAEVQRIGGIYPLLSSNIETRLDGRPKSGTGEPQDSGVCLYFQLKGAPMAMACDAYTRVADNIAALAAHLAATRAIERHGVATASETLQAFQALPPPLVTPSKKPWAEVFGVMEMTATEEMIQALYRSFAKRRASDEAALAELNIARDDALAAIRAKTALV